MNKKIALITGSSTGIGFGCVEEFLKNGWEVLAHFYEETDKFSSLVSKNKIEPINCDFSNENDVNDFLIFIKKRNISALVNSSGCFDFSHNQKNRIEAAKQVFQINTIVPTMIAEACLIKMKEAGFGRIVNLSSIGVKFGSNIENIFYGSSKIGLEAATRSLAREGSASNVLVNAIRPGITDTEFYKRIGKDLTERSKLIPLKRAAQPIEIAKFIYFLCSQDNTYITGQVLPISGGE